MASKILTDLRDAAKFCFHSKVRAALTLAPAATLAVGFGIGLGVAAAPVAAAATVAGLIGVSTRMSQFHAWRQNTQSASLG